MAKKREWRRRAVVWPGKRSTLYGFASTLLIAALVSTTVRARDDYPSRPVKLIIPFAAGGPTDIVGRVMGAKMGQLLGQQFVAGQTQVLLETVALTPAPGALQPGMFKVIDPQTITFQRPANLPSGVYAVRIRVNQVESPPGWWIKF